MSEDSSMEMQMSDSSRKRTLDHQADYEMSQNKRTHVVGEVFLKQLIPATLAGVVLGKGGETISRLQSETSTHIKMSKGGEYYPGTMDRVLLINGPEAGVRTAHGEIWSKLRERVDTSTMGEELKIKLLVPHATVGMIIGKSGAHIKQIKEASGAYIQISQKSDDPMMFERVVTIAGSQESLNTAFEQVFKTIIDDPQSGSCPTLSYSDYHMPAVGHGGSNASFPMATDMRARGGAAAACGPPPSAIEALKMTLRNGGHSVQASEEITAAMCTLANYGMLGFGLGFGPCGYGMGGVGASGGSVGGLSMEYLAGILCGAAGVGGGPVHGGGSSRGGSAGGYGEKGFGKGDGGYHNGSENYHYGNMSNSGSGYGGWSGGNQMGGAMSQMGGANQEQVTEEMQVGEALVGAVLGHGGKAIVEIQKMTGATVQISKKGIFAPGTKNRVVTVQGARFAVDKAMYHIKQCIEQEEMKRSRQEQMFKQPMM